MLIGAHDAFTGEKCMGLFSKLLTPFDQCQNLTIDELIKCNVKYLDVRFIKVDRNYKNNKTASNGDGMYVGCHGFGLYKYTLEELFEKVSKLDILLRVGHENLLFDDGVSKENFTSEVLQFAERFGIKDKIASIYYKNEDSSSYPTIKWKELFFGAISYYHDPTAKQKFINWIKNKTIKEKGYINHCYPYGGFKVPLIKILPIPPFAMWVEEVRNTVYEVAKDSEAIYVINFVENKFIK
jgi:hypothetical protein